MIAWVLHLQTSLALGAASALVIALWFGVLWFITRRHPGLPWVSLGYLASALTSACLWAVTQRWGTPATAVLSHLFQGGSLLCWLLGVAHIFQRPLHWAQSWGVLALFLALVAVFQWVHPSFFVRQALYETVTAYFACRLVLLAWPAMRLHKRPILTLVVLLPFAVLGAQYGWRAAWLWQDLWSNDGDAADRLRLIGNAMRSSDLAGAMLGVAQTVAQAFSIMMMVSDRMTQRLQDLASHDSLTNALNRRAFMEQLPRDRARARRQDTQLALLLIDVDHFKAINDTHGHLAGDAYLKALVLELRSVLRQEDLLCRYGGEEFCAAVAVDDRASALHMAERLRARIEALQLPFAGRTVQTTVSIGVALLGDENDAAVAMHSTLHHADLAVYEAKHQGRNGVRFKSPPPWAPAPA